MAEQITTTGNWLADVAGVVAARASRLIGREGGSAAPFIATAEAQALAQRLGQGALTPLTEIEAQMLARASDLARLAGLPITRMMTSLQLPPNLVPLIALLLLPETDAGFLQLFAFLNDDAQRRMVTPALARRLLGGLPFPATVLLAPDGPMLGPALIDAPDASRPFDDRPLRLRDGVAAFLLDQRSAATPDAELTRFLRPVPAGPLTALAGLAEDVALDRLLCLARQGLVLTGTPGSGRLALAAALATSAGTAVMALDAQAIALDPLCEPLIAVALREAAILPAHLILIDAEALSPGQLARLAGAGPPVTLLAQGRLQTDLPHVALRPPGRVTARRLWSAALGSDDLAATLAHRFRLPVTDLLAVARDSAGGDLEAAARACLERSSTALDTLAKRVETTQGWDDLILPDRQMSALHGLLARATHARRVYDDWGFGRKLSPDRGLTALFSGPSGAGKTLSASIVARALGLPLYRVDLSSTVSKYIGETEKHLEQIFTAAEGGNACLFFDECDALFGKRSEVSDAHDRYANIETSYLLQRLETHRGIVILASNHPQNIDDAFTRRIDVTVSFPMPDAETRARLWQALLPEETGAEIDADLLGRQFDLSGGAIRNCLVTAAFLAAAEGGIISTEHCLRAVAQEYEKSGRPLTRTEFGEAFSGLRLRRGR